MRTASTCLLITAQLFSFIASGQVQDDFSDGDYSAQPVWTGQGEWTVDGDGRLQSNHTVANSSFYLSTANSLTMMTQWEFQLRLSFNTSSANYVDAYLIATAQDLSAQSTTGYFLRIGNTQDEVSLYRKDPSGLIFKLIDGTDGITASADNSLKIKVTRDAAGKFRLYRDASAAGTGFVYEGEASDPTYLSGAYFGFLVRQSTSGFFRKHFFDDVLIQPYQPDLTPPSIENITAVSATEAALLFSEAVEPVSAENPANYQADNGIGPAIQAARDPLNHALVRLRFAAAFPSGAVNTLTVQQVSDLSGNALNGASAGFSYYIPRPHDIIIDEIMADPSPPVSLPEAEYIELKNTSAYKIDLAGWRLGFNQNLTAPLPACMLLPDSFVLLTHPSHAAAVSAYGRVLPLPSMPSLSNEGGLLYLQSPAGLTIHALAYNNDWYGSEIKKTGGWSLEMVDTRNPCTGKGNWKASTAIQGGSPGRKNATDAVNLDEAPPRLLRTFSIDSLTLAAVFDEGLDSLSASAISSYNLGLSLTAALPKAPMFNQVVLILAAPMQGEKVYTLSVTGIRDCRGNAMAGENKAKAGLTSLPTAHDIVLNEILFNPPSAGADYVEIYNRGNKVVDVHNLFLASRNGAGQLTTAIRLSEVPLQLFPGEYLVITEDPDALYKSYFVKTPSSVLPCKPLPSLPDDEGTVVLLSSSGEVVDEFSYSEKYHFKLIANAEGVALERVDPSGESQAPQNWHSAASSAGYGTPGYLNSQYRLLGDIEQAIEVEPRVVSPDNDGFDDAAIIRYSMETAGYVANLVIFDAGGRPVRYFLKNALLGTKGSWTWDGLDEQGKALPPGPYILQFEVFKLDGKKNQFRKVIVLARKPN
ncbi:MAG TPA: lamin tail domain-containing protein [Flavisolibacter sp.]|nr:lamin tail domain-containing protein [Flavisolibacter sp.]